MAQDHGLCKKTLAGSQAAHMQSLARKMKVWGTWPAAQMQSWASPFYGWRTTAHGLPKCSLHVAAAYRQSCSTGNGVIGHNTVRGPPLQTRVVAAYGTVSQLANMLVNKQLHLTMIMAHME